MSDDLGRQEGHAPPPDPRAWPPPVPSGIHLRSRSAASPAPARWAADPAPLTASTTTVAPLTAGATPDPVTAAASRAPVARTAPAPVTASRPPVSAAIGVAQGPPAPREAAASDGLVLDPVGYRLRLVRDAAAALSLALGAVLVLSLVAQPAPAGAVLSATGAPGAEAGDPRGAPGVLVSPGADPGGAGAGAPTDGAGSAAPSPAPGGSSVPAAIPAPTQAASSPARSAP